MFCCYACIFFVTYSYTIYIIFKGEVLMTGKKRNVHIVFPMFSAAIVSLLFIYVCGEFISYSWESELANILVFSTSIIVAITSFYVFYLIKEYTYNAFTKYIFNTSYAFTSIYNFFVIMGTISTFLSLESKRLFVGMNATLIFFHLLLLVLLLVEYRYQDEECRLFSRKA